MGVQSRANNTTVPFVRSGTSYTKDGQILLNDAGRTTDLLTYTLMAQIAATKKWVPFTSEVATDGSAIAKGIYLGDDVPFADIAAGDVADFGPILVGGACTIDNGQLVIENSKTLDTVVGAATVEAHRVEDDLNEVGIFVEDTIDIDEFEN